MREKNFFFIINLKIEFIDQFEDSHKKGILSGNCPRFDVKFPLFSTLTSVSFIFYLTLNSFVVSLAPSPLFKSNIR